ncbi:MAG: VanZ family protein [Dehalococcoidia bacterium]
MDRRTLRRVSQAATALAALVILYVMLTPDPPRLSRLLHVDAPATAPVAAPAAAPAASPAPAPRWTDQDEEDAGHAALFALLGASAALWYATSDAARRAPQRTLLTYMLALWLFGGLTELAQTFTETRTASLSDVGFDVIGAIAGFLAGGAAWRLLLRRRAR